MRTYDICSHVSYDCPQLSCTEGREGEGGTEGGEWKNLRGGGGNGDQGGMVRPSQDVASWVKRGQVGIGQVRLENGGNIVGQHRCLFSLDCRGYTGGRCSPTL